LLANAARVSSRSRRRDTPRINSALFRARGCAQGASCGAIAALLTQRNIEEAAKSIGIGTQTLLRWLKIPEFDKAYREARRAAYSQATARLQQATGAAVSTLLKIMVDTNAPPSTRVCVPPTACWITRSRR